MIGLLTAISLQAAAPPPPVIVDAIRPHAVPEIAWTCTLHRRDRSTFNVSGVFPAVPVEAQTGGRAFHLQSVITSPDFPSFKGSFATAMTFAVAGFRRYSIAVSDRASAAGGYIMTFELFAKSQDGFVLVASGAAGGAPMSAHSAGLCETKER